MSQTKRIRMTKGRDRVWLQFMRTITATWARAVREQIPMSETHRKLSDAINALDIASSYKADLHARNRGACDLVIALHAEAWNNFTDALCKERRITSKQYNTWTHPWKES